MKIYELFLTCPKGLEKVSKAELSLMGISNISIKPGGNYQQIPNSIASPRVLRIKKTGGRTTTYGRLHQNKFSATINTYFNRPNVGTNYHYSQKRLITPREALRIQSFPDSFTPEYSSIRSLCRQIGNAVPPLLSLFLAHGVKSIFRK